MDIITEIFSALWGVWKEMWKAFWDVFPKALSFFFWIILGIFILPCVFVAGNIYPWWSDWGEEL